MTLVSRGQKLPAVVLTLLVLLMGCSLEKGNPAQKSGDKTSELLPEVERTVVLPDSVTFDGVTSATADTGTPSIAADQQMLDTARATSRSAMVVHIAPTAKDTWLFSRVAEIAVDRRGQLFVLDDIDCRIHVFNARGVRVRSLTWSRGLGPWGVQTPA